MEEKAAEPTLESVIIPWLKSNPRNLLNTPKIINLVFTDYLIHIINKVADYIATVLNSTIKYQAYRVCHMNISSTYFTENLCIDFSIYIDGEKIILYQMVIKQFVLKSCPHNSNEITRLIYEIGETTGSIPHLSKEIVMNMLFSDIVKQIYIQLSIIEKIKAAKRGTKRKQLEASAENVKKDVEKNETKKAKLDDNCEAK